MIVSLLSTNRPIWNVTFSRNIERERENRPLILKRERRALRDESRFTVWCLHLVNHRRYATYTMRRWRSWLCPGESEIGGNTCISARDIIYIRIENLLYILWLYSYNIIYARTEGATVFSVGFGMEKRQLSAPVCPGTTQLSQYKYYRLSAERSPAFRQ